MRDKIIDAIFDAWCDSEDKRYPACKKYFRSVMEKELFD